MKQRVYVVTRGRQVRVFWNMEDAMKAWREPDAEVEHVVRIQSVNIE